MKIQEELVHLPDNHSFLIRAFSNFTLDQPIHQHSHFYELTFTLGVSGSRIIGDTTSEFSRLDLVLMAPGVPHCWSDYGVKSTKEIQQLVVIHFSESIIDSNQLGLLHFDSIKRALEWSKYGLELSGDSLHKGAEIMKKMNATSSLDNYLKVLSVLHLFGSKNESKKICSEGYSTLTSQDKESKIEKAYAFIQDNYTRKMNIEEVAAHVHMSPSAFSHFFKKWSYKSFTDFVTEFRLGRAARLLQFTDQSVSSIAYESGFQNISYFNRSFSQKFGCSPLKFRRKFDR